MTTYTIKFWDRQLAIESETHSYRKNVHLKFFFHFLSIYFNEMYYYDIILMNIDNIYTKNKKIGQSESKGWSQLVTMHQKEMLVITAQVTNFVKLTNIFNTIGNWSNDHRILLGQADSSDQ